MVEINIKDDLIQLEEFKVVSNNENYTVTRSNDMRVCIILKNISVKESDNIKSKLRGDGKTLPFGRFDFKGCVTFSINNFYISLYNVYLSGFSVILGIDRLTINFKPLDNFEYSSGMGLGVLRELKLKDIGI